MEKKYFDTLANFNHWADTLVLGWLQQISDEQWHQVNASSFSSVAQTALHIASAEKVWIDFWQKAPEPVYLSAQFNGTRQELIAIYTTASAGLKAFVTQSPAAHLHTPITFRYPRGGEASMEFWQTVSHVVNHTTYHRGQLVTLLRQVGFTAFTSTDLATYYLKNK
jgi:uncharacterized damage-inducible protein DinB